MNSSPTANFFFRRWSILLFVALIAALIHGSAQAVPIWLLVVPFVLLAAEELNAERRGRREDRESNPALPGASGSQRLIPISTVAFHGVVIASVFGAHWEMGRGGVGSAGTASHSRYVMSKVPSSGGCGTGGMCGGTAGGASGGCGSGGCGSAGAKSGGGCGSGCGGGAVNPKTVASTTSAPPSPVQVSPMARVLNSGPIANKGNGLVIPGQKGNEPFHASLPQQARLGNTVTGLQAPQHAAVKVPAPDLVAAMKRALELKNGKATQAAGPGVDSSVTIKGTSSDAPPVAPATTAPNLPSPAAVEPPAKSSP